MFSDAAFAVTQQQANAMLAAQNWSGATQAFEELLREDSRNPSHWFGLGQARHNLGGPARARRAHLNALAYNHPTPGRVRLQLARALMTMGRRDEAVFAGD
jgi:predicted Zn-dependent protease